MLAADQIPSAEACLAIGDSYLIDEDCENAINSYAMALSLCQDDNDDEGGRVTRFRALSHNTEALIRLERFDEAMEHGKLAVASIVPGLREGETEACYHRVGVVLFHLKQYDEAESMFRQAVQLATLNNKGDAKDRHNNYIQRCKAAKRSNIDPEDSEMLIVEEIPQKSPARSGDISSSTPEAVTRIQQPTMPKYQYYQTEKVMTIAILEPNMRNEDLQVKFGTKRLTVIVKKQNFDFTVICGRLYDKVKPEKCKVIIKSEKVLIKLHKADPHDWHELMSKRMYDDEDEDDDVKDSSVAKASATASAPSTENSTMPPSKPPIPRPYVSHRDWDAIERDLKHQEKQEKPQGEEAMNALFQSIYSKADPDTQRAMIKSFQTSGGTVLSTNWDEVKSKDYEQEREAPKGMEWKTWEGQKLDQKKT